MDDRNAPLERIRTRYTKRAANLNVTADTALSEAVDAYCVAQEKTLENADNVAEETYNEASEKANLVVSSTDGKACEALLAAYVEFGVRK